MAPFDIEAARKGAKICTNDGTPVRILHFDEKGIPPYTCAVGVLVGAKDNIAPTLFNIHGRRADKAPWESDCCLMMADDDYLEKLERGEYDKPSHDAPVWQEPHRIMTTEKLEKVVFLSPSDEAYWLKQYAGMAMQGLSSDWECKKMATGSEDGAIDTIVYNAVKMALVLINELKKLTK